MRAVLELGLAVLCIVALLVIVGGVTGVMLGALVGAFLVTVDAIVGPIGPMRDGAAAWWVLSILVLVLAVDAVRGRSRGRRAGLTAPTKKGGAA